jgi:hypothetical protein
MDNTIEGNKFLEILIKRESNFVSVLKDMKKKGMDGWVNLLGSDLGSHAGYPHLHNVELIANKIIPDRTKNSFTDAEIFLLLSAIFLHDIGRTFPSVNKPKDTKCGLEAKRCPILGRSKTPPCLKANSAHYLVGGDYVKNNGLSLGLPDESIAKYCGLLVYCHGLQQAPSVDQPMYVNPKSEKKCIKTLERRVDYRTTSLEPYGTIRIPLLAAILRISDETDNSWTRALHKHWLVEHEINLGDTGKGFRSCIEDIEFCPDGKCLVIHISEMIDEKTLFPKKSSYRDSIDKVRSVIQNVLTDWNSELKKIGVEFDDVYIEYQNRIFKKIDFNPIVTKYPHFITVFAPDKYKAIDQMLNGMFQLYLGSCGYAQFSWEILEAQVGRPLTSVDKWLARRIADASSNKVIITEQNEIHINLNRDEAESIKRHILAQERIEVDEK